MISTRWVGTSEKAGAAHHEQHLHIVEHVLLDLGFEQLVVERLVSFVELLALVCEVGEERDGEFAV